MRDLGRIGSERYWGAVWNFGLLEGEEVKVPGRKWSSVVVWFESSAEGKKACRGWGRSRVISTDLWFIFSNI